MPITYLAMIFSLLFVSQGSRSQITAAIAAIRTSNPKVQWDAKNAVTADITCDGIADVVVVGYDDKSVWVALVPGMKDGTLAKPIVYQYPVNAGVQSGFCAKPVHIEIYPLSCEEEGKRLPGCKPVKGASSFSLEDGACDSFNFYGDSQQKVLQWWRN
jgi:hypothetical protein